MSSNTERSINAPVALVAVADHIFLSLGLVVGEFPLASGGEAAAAAAAKSGGEHIIDDLLAGFRQSVRKTPICAHGKSLLEAVGVDYAAAVKSDFNLLFVEGDFLLLGDFSAGLRVGIEQAFDGFAAENVLVNDFFNILGSDLAVEHILGIDTQERSLGAESEAAYAANLDLVAYSLFLDYVVKLLLKGVCAAGGTAAASAEHNIGFAVAAVEFNVKHFLGGGSPCHKLFSRLYHYSSPPPRSSSLQ